MSCHLLVWLNSDTIWLALVTLAFFSYPDYWSVRTSKPVWNSGVSVFSVDYSCWVEHCKGLTIVLCCTNPTTFMNLWEILSLVLSRFFFTFYVLDILIDRQSPIKNMLSSCIMMCIYMKVINRYGQWTSIVVDLLALFIFTIWLPFMVCGYLYYLPIHLVESSNGCQMQLTGCLHVLVSVIIFF